MENIEDTAVADKNRLGLLDLTRLIPQGGLSSELFFLLAIDMATELEKIHSSGEYHTNLRPDKYLCNNEYRKPVLLNTRPSQSCFGEIAEREDLYRLCQDSYLAPEQKALILSPQGKHSDIFSLGLCFYYILCGQELIPRGLSAKDSLAKLDQLDAEVQAISNFSTERVPEPLILLLRYMLVAHPEARIQTASEVIDILKKIHLGADLVAISQVFSGPVRSHYHHGIDRSQEFSVIKNKISRLSESAQLISIEGSAGSGKSLFLHHAAIELTNQFHCIVQVQLKSTHKEKPYYLVKEILKQLRLYLLNHSDFDTWKDELKFSLPSDGAYLNFLVSEFQSMFPYSVEEPESVFLRCGLIQQSVIAFFSIFSQKNIKTAIFIDNGEYIDLDSLALMQKLWDHDSTQFLQLMTVNQKLFNSVEFFGEGFNGYQKIEFSGLTQEAAAQKVSTHYQGIEKHDDFDLIVSKFLVFSRGNVKLFDHFCKLSKTTSAVLWRDGQWQVDKDSLDSLKDINLYEYYTCKLSTLDTNFIKTLLYAEMINRTMPSASIDLLKNISGIVERNWDELLSHNLLITSGKSFSFRDDILNKILSEYWTEDQLYQSHLMLWNFLRDMAESNLEDWVSCLNPVQHLIEDSALKIQLLEHNYQYAQTCRFIGAPQFAEHSIRQAMQLLELYQLQSESQLCDQIYHSYGEILAINGKLGESDELFHRLHDNCDDAHDQDLISLKQYELMVSINQALQNQVRQKKSQLYSQQKSLSETKQQLWESQKSLVDSEKMAALGRLVAGMTHEINTPVGISITGMSHFIDRTKQIKKSYYNQSMTQKELEFYFDSSEQAADITFKNLLRAADLIRSFKRISADQSTELASRFKFIEYIKEILLSLSSQYSKSGVSVSVVERDDFPVRSHPGWFSQIFTNLIMNSLIHGFEDGQGGDISIEVTKLDGILRVEYRDSGKGISEEQKRQIFDPFYTTNRDGGGTGLGMSVIWDIVTESLEGTIDCQSEVGKGVCFSIDIPFASLDIND